MQFFVFLMVYLPVLNFPLSTLWALRLFTLVFSFFHLVCTIDHWEVTNSIKKIVMQIIRSAFMMSRTDASLSLAAETDIARVEWTEKLSLTQAVFNTSSSYLPVGSCTSRKRGSLKEMDRLFSRSFLVQPWFLCSFRISFKTPDWTQCMWAIENWG